MSSFHSVAIFCGSSPGHSEHYLKMAFEVGSVIGQRNLRLIYGGAQVGLMGAAADGALSEGGEVIGILPGFLRTKEIAHPALTKLIVVETMHERKLKMHEYSDAIIALPGGWGTMEELTEMLTWAQLGLHTKPIGLLNVTGFYNGFLQLIETMTSQGFLKEEYAAMLIVADNIYTLLDSLAAYEPPTIPKWMVEERT